LRVIRWRREETGGSVAKAWFEPSPEVARAVVTQAEAEGALGRAVAVTEGGATAVAPIVADGTASSREARRGRGGALVRCRVGESEGLTMSLILAGRSPLS
jgi:hypothetical protein